MSLVIRFVFGLALGSFLNVVATRYREDDVLFSRRALGGRSVCQACKKHLRWFELVPLLSFFIQRRRCRACRARISWQYPLVELGSALIFALVPVVVHSPYLLPTTYYLLASFWVAVFLILLLIAIIDIRLNIIPDEANIILLVLGVGIMAAGASSFGPTGGSFVGDYAFMFGFRESIVVNHVFAAVVALVLFGTLIAATRGRGMGMGDLKLIVPLGVVFGWPDIVFTIVFSFIIGSLWGIGVLFFRKKTLRSSLPFAPFLALGSLTVFFFGSRILVWYFGLFV